MIETDGLRFLRKLAGYHAGQALIATIKSERDYHLGQYERFAAEELSISDRVRIDIEARRLADELCRRAAQYRVAAA